ncbi:hypothetical protein [Gimesia algae]|uniref:Formyltransferase/hydrolase complex Fhc subunit B n=1 Tax=Gimesia algae TaxID=2527971 RepID=A0A517V7Y5_9PLAN|nr:hypothetical protein [Gimesia algae]QDT89118.1 hypothetical protein Pan161_07440 [Gimesia algae]
MKTLIEDVTCAGCYCACDDIQVTSDGQQIQEVQTTCSQGQVWFERAAITDQLVPRILGRPVSQKEAIERAVELIQQSLAPLVTGLSQSSTDAQRAAVALADQLGATIDTGAAAVTRALQQVGEATCTLGEVRSRADLIIYWGAADLLVNANHRQSLETNSAEVSRKVIVMGEACSRETEFADEYIQVEPERELEVIWQLRALLKGVDLAGKEPVGIAESELQSLASQLKQSKYSVFFTGPEFKQGALAHRKLEALSLLIKEIQSERRCHAITVPAAKETKGAEHVLAWQTGYAAAVNFASGFPRYSPGEYQATRLLEQSEVDLCILVGGNPQAGLSEQTIKCLSNIPSIQIGPALIKDFQPHVFLPAGITGIHFPGSMYRYDGTPLPLRGFLPTVQNSEAEVLIQISKTL